MIIAYCQQNGTYVLLYISRSTSFNIYLIIRCLLTSFKIHLVSNLLKNQIIQIRKRLFWSYLLVVCGRLLVVRGRLWSLVDGLWSLPVLVTTICLWYIIPWYMWQVRTNHYMTFMTEVLICLFRYIFIYRTITVNIFITLSAPCVCSRKVSFHW